MTCTPSTALRRPLLLLLLLSANAALAQSGVAPAYVPIQGYLTDPAGVPIDGDVAMVISLYTQAEDVVGDPANEPFHSEQQTVTVSDGLFTAFLGDTNALDVTAFGEKPRGIVFLGIAVGGEPELRPRLQLGTAPFAGFAQTCGDALTLGGQPAAAFALAGQAQSEGTTVSAPPPTKGAVTSEKDQTVVGRDSARVELSRQTITCPGKGAVIALLNTTANWASTGTATREVECRINIELDGTLPDGNGRQTQASIMQSAARSLVGSMPLSMHKVLNCNAEGTLEVVFWGLTGVEQECAFSNILASAFFVPAS